MNPNDRSDQILRAADLLGGGIVMQTVHAIFPDAQPDILRRVVAKLARRGALVGVWAGELGCKVFLTTAGSDGRESGVRHWIKNPVAAREALETGSIKSAIKLPVRFLHNQLAGLVSLGLGDGVGELERELWQQRTDAPMVADGYAWPERDRRIVVEVERMVNQSPHRWKQKNGIVERVTQSFAPDNTHPAWTDEYLIVAPRSLKLHPELEQELAELVDARAAKNYKNRPGAGWWFLPIEDMEADPTWHGARGDSSPPRPLPGIRSRRLACLAGHEDRAAIDRARKARKEREAASPPSSAAANLQAGGGFAAAAGSGV